MSAFSAGLFLSISLIMAIGPQNAHLIRMGLRRQHLWLTVGVCVLADMTLISIGVLGVSKLGGLSPAAHKTLLLVGVLFLVTYGFKAARQSYRRWQHTPTSQGAHEQPSPYDAPEKSLTRKQAALTALAFSWLNPHAWLDTAVLIGSASLAYQSPNNTVFGLGAMTGAVIWFISLGSLACWLGQRLELNKIAHWIDGLVAIIMWVIAALLALQMMAI